MKISRSFTSAPARRSAAGRFPRSWRRSSRSRRGAGRRVIVTSGPSERQAAVGIIDDARGQLPASERHRVLDCGDFSLSELRALLERSAVYIGGDSGPLHLAATTRVPIVAIFGPTPSERSAPWRDSALLSESIEIDGLSCRPCDQRVCVPGDFRCLTRIDAPRVIAAAERLLAARQGVLSPPALRSDSSDRRRADPLRCAGLRTERAAAPRGGGRAADPPGVRPAGQRNRPADGSARPLPMVRQLDYDRSADARRSCASGGVRSTTSSVRASRRFDGLRPMRRPTSCSPIRTRMVRRDLGPLADRLAAGAVFMHHREYSLAAPPRKGDRSLAHEIVGRTWHGITPDATSAMWNAGVVASSRRHARHLRPHACGVRRDTARHAIFRRGPARVQYRVGRVCANRGSGAVVRSLLGEPPLVQSGRRAVSEPRAARGAHAARRKRSAEEAAARRPAGRSRAVVARAVAQDHLTSCTG